MNRKKYKYNNESLTAIEWSDKLGIPRGTIYSRARIGMALDAVTCDAQRLFEYKREKEAKKGRMKRLKKWLDLDIKDHVILEDR